MRRSFLVILACGAITAGALTGCGMLPDPASEIVHKNSTVPRLITWTQRLKQQAEERGNALGATEWTKELTKEQEPIKEDIGSHHRFDELLLNEGPPSTGIKIMLTGTAIQEGFFGNPEPAEVATYQDLPDNKVPGGFGTLPGMLADTRGAQMEERKVPFQNQGSAWVAVVPDLKYLTSIDVSVNVNALKRGTGTLFCDVSPIDPKGSSTVHMGGNATAQVPDTPTDTPTSPEIGGDK